MAAEIKANLEGTWTHVKSEKLDEYLDKLGVGLIKKTAAKQLSPTLVISVDGETISVSISAGPKSQKTSYKLGEEYSIEGEFGTGKAVTTYADGKMTTVITPNDSSKKGQTVVREIDNGQLVQTMKIDGLEAKRYFNKK